MRIYGEKAATFRVIQRIESTRSASERRTYMGDAGSTRQRRGVYQARRGTSNTRLQLVLSNVRRTRSRRGCRAGILPACLPESTALRPQPSVCHLAAFDCRPLLHRQTAAAQAFDVFLG